MGMKVRFVGLAWAPYIISASHLYSYMSSSESQLAQHVRKGVTCDCPSEQEVSIPHLGINQEVKLTPHLVKTCCERETVRAGIIHTHGRINST